MALLKIMRGRLLILAALATTSLAAPGLRAAEQITLRNGFAVRCDHHALVEDRMRLFMGAGAENYIEFPSQDIATIDVVPDPPPPPPQAQNSSAAAGPANPVPAAPVPAVIDTRLTPADLHQILARAGQAHDLDADLLASVVKAESDGNPRAVSRAGARGLMQLMPGTASTLGVQDSYKPEDNVRGGSTYLDYLLVRYHDNLALALAAYNAGPEAVDRYHGIPPYHETRAYVARVIHEFNRRVMAREAQQKAATTQTRAMQN